jgi:hypothetical protein
MWDKKQKRSMKASELRKPWRSLGAYELIAAEGDNTDFPA